MGLTATLIRTAGAQAGQRALPVYLGVLMIAGVVFGPNGMDTATAVAGMQTSVGARSFLWLVWLLLCAPAARAVFASPSLDYLRWLPVAQTRIWLLLGALLIALQTPWVLLFAIGGGPVPALSALWLSAGVHAVVAIRPRPGERWRKWLVLALACALWAAPWPISLNIQLIAHGLAGVGMWLLALPIAWRRAPERNREQRSVPLLAGAIPALAQCHLACVSRRHGPALWRAALLMALGAGATFVLARANQLSGEEVAVYSAVVAVLCATVASSGIAAGIAESELGLHWLLASTGTGARQRLGARLAASACAGALLGLLYGAVLVFVIPMSPLSGARVISGAVAIAIAQMWLAQAIASWSVRGHDERPGSRRTGRRRGDGERYIDGGRLVGGLVLVAVAQLMALGMFGDIAILGFASLAFASNRSRL